jgi:hypothetical protein
LWICKSNDSDKGFHYAISSIAMNFFIKAFNS